MKLTPDYLWQGVSDGFKTYDQGADTLVIRLSRPRLRVGEHERAKYQHISFAFNGAPHPPVKVGDDFTLENLCVMMNAILALEAE